MHKNASSSSGSEEKFTSSTKRSRNQQNRQFTFSSSSNGKQNSQRLSNNINNHSWNSYKPNPSPKKNYDSQRSYYSRATGSSRPYDHDVDASLSERLHNMNATHPSN
ncbi:unnamed protein product [Trichobilharzia regenti]|nr:unnamed protein product [Trichobilharzia regenti]